MIKSYRKLLLGNGIWVNSKYLPKEWNDFLDTLQEKYGDLFDFDRMSNVESSGLIFWQSKPVELKSGWSRPLIINNPNQLELMHPTPDGPETDSKEVWAPSYDSFTVRLLDHPETTRTQLINEILSRQYELNEKYPVKGPLTQEERQHLTMLLNSKPYTLLGQFMIYVLG